MLRAASTVSHLDGASLQFGRKTGVLSLYYQLAMSEDHSNRGDSNGRIWAFQADRCTAGTTD
jgi:hypothetical protein